jgi:mxaJ protein
MRSLRFLAALVLIAGAAHAAEPPLAVLRVCSDPDNLPFSHEDGSGFENRIARLLADELGVPLQYEWLPDRRGFVRKTLGSRLCDLIIGVPVEFERTMPTLPYYRSTYVFVEPSASQPPLASFDDSRLRQRRIGVQVIGSDFAASPPGHALAKHGATSNVVGYTLAGETPSAARLVDAVARGNLDAAVLWGPQAGYYVQRSPVALRMTPAVPPAGAAQPFEFSIAMGLRREDKALQQALNEIIRRRRSDIDAILAHYNVPRLPLEEKAR